jgi:hypothetical protein
MRSIHRFLWMAILLAACSVQSVPGKNAVGGIHIGESIILAAGEASKGDLVAVDCSVNLAEGSVLHGNVILLGGSLESHGSLDGDIASIGASIHIAATADIDGSIASIGPEPNVEEGARISGSIKSIGGISQTGSLWTGIGQNGFGLYRFSLGGWPSGHFNLWYEITSLLFRILLLSAVAVLVVLFLPSPTGRISRTVIEQPAIAFLAGILSLAAAAALLLFLFITICLSPLSLLGSVVLVASLLLGWVSIGWEIGKRTAAVFHLTLHPATMAGLGTMILTLAAGGIGYIPCVGPILVALTLALGLGAVVLTRFGGREYLPARSGPASGSNPSRIDPGAGASHPS